MKIICSYVRVRRREAFLVVLLLLIWTILFWLSEVPLEVIFYGMLLCAAGVMTAAIGGFFCYWKKIRKLEDIRSAIPYELREFPDACDRTELLYQEMTETLFASRVILENEALFGKKEAADYYSLWVHQIKTPIAAMHLLIQSYEECILEDENMQEKSAAFLKEMKLKLFQTEEYVGMVLTYLRVGDISADLKFQWYCIGDIIKQAIRKYSHIFILKGIKLQYDDSDKMILTDEKWLMLVLEQILSNALKYTQEGTISVYVDRKALVIEDTGIGIEKDDLPRIFEKGFTGYNGRQEKKSTGIGLYLSKEILKKLGHEITAESEPGKGTKMRIRFERETCRTMDGNLTEM